MSVVVPPSQKMPSGPPVKLKMRPDLTFDRQTYQGVEFWVVKEPLGQKYFQFPPSVFYLLKQLDGEQTIDGLQDKYHAEYAPKRITRQDLQQLLTRFHNDGLVTSDVAGQGSELMKRGEKNTRMERLQMMSNILAIRYRGFDPEGILNFLNRYLWWIFTFTCMCVVIFAASVALLSVLINWSAFQAKLPGFEAFFDPKQWYLFVGVLAVTKMFHEFGHGLSCKRLGGECHEIGFMLLVLTPCLYCNVSDSWRLNNKWHRAAIGAAGMYVEIILATIATFTWWFVQPGLIQEICLKVMLVSSVSTVLFNGNPLLRFDGYYILSDILEIPNLSQKSTKALTTLMGRNWLGLEIPDDHLMPTNRPWAFALFTVASFCYRWLIMFSIIFFLMTWLEPYGLESLGVGIALFSLIGIVVMPGYKLYKYMSVPGRMHQVKKVRFFSILGAVLLLLAVILLTPLPHYLRCALIVVPDKLETIYIQEQGILEECLVKPGEVVEKGQVLARLTNLDLALELADAEGKLKAKQAQLQSSMAAGAMDNSGKYLDELATLNSEIVELSQLVNSLNTQNDSLVLKAQVMGGTVLETPYQHPKTSMRDIPNTDQQPLLSGKNESVSVSRGQRFCEVADLSKWQAYVLLTEQQIKFAKVGNGAKMKLYSRPWDKIEAEIEEVGVTDLSINRDSYEMSQQEIAQLGQQNEIPDLVLEMVAQYQKPELQYYARVPLPTDQKLRIGIGGQARLFTGYRSLGARLLWWVNQTFRL